MTTIKKAAAAHHVLINGGWTNASNAFSTDPGDNVYATCAPAKNTTVRGSFQFAPITYDDIPHGSTINSVTSVFEGKLSAVVTGGVIGNQITNQGTNSGTEGTLTGTTTETDITTTAGAVTADDIVNGMNTVAGTGIEASMRGTKGSTNSALTCSLDFVYLSVDYTPATQYSSAADAFGRTTSNGWGTADSGGAWNIGAGTTSHFSTDGSVGIIAPTASGNEYEALPEFWLADQDFKVGCQMDVLPSSAGATNQWILHLRKKLISLNTEYRVVVLAAQNLTNLQARVDKMVAGAFTGNINGSSVDTGIAKAASTKFWIRAEINGTTIQVKVWQDGTAEPTSWLISFTDSSISGNGMVGLQAYSDAGTVTYSFDDISAGAIGTNDTIVNILKDFQHSPYMSIVVQ